MQSLIDNPSAINRIYDRDIYLYTNWKRNLSNFYTATDAPAVGDNIYTSTHMTTVITTVAEILSPTSIKGENGNTYTYVEAIYNRTYSETSAPTQKAVHDYLVASFADIDFSNVSAAGKQIIAHNSSPKYTSASGPTTLPASGSVYYPTMDGYFCLYFKKLKLASGDSNKQAWIRLENSNNKFAAKTWQNITSDTDEVYLSCYMPATRTFGITIYYHLPENSTYENFSCVVVPLIGEGS